MLNHYVLAESENRTGMESEKGTRMESALLLLFLCMRGVHSGMPHAIANDFENVHVVYIRILYKLEQMEMPNPSKSTQQVPGASSR